MTRILLTGLLLCALVEAAAAQAPLQPKGPQGTAERIGEQIDRGLTEIGAELKKAWAEARQSVEKMGVQGRVYGRLHWDKALEGATLDISVRDNNVVVISGKVANAAAKQKAEQLARDTIGVSSVVNELKVSEPQ